MRLTDKIIAAIRTFVPIVIGAVFTWLARKGFIIDEDAQASVIIGFQAAITSLYWALVTAASKRWPMIQWLLGYAASPQYKKD